MKHTEKYVLVPYDEYKKTSVKCDRLVSDGLEQRKGDGSEDRAGSVSLQETPPANDQTENMQNSQDFNVDNFITYLSKCGGGMCDGVGGNDEPPSASLPQTPLPPTKKAKRDWISI